jgi:hypothetical protein
MRVSERETERIFRVRNRARARKKSESKAMKSVGARGFAPKGIFRANIQSEKQSESEKKEREQSDEIRRGARLRAQRHFQSEYSE